MKARILIGLAIIVGCAVGWIVLDQRHAARQRVGVPLNAGEQLDDWGRPRAGDTKTPVIPAPISELASSSAAATPVDVPRIRSESAFSAGARRTAPMPPSPFSAAPIKQAIDAKRAATGAEPEPLVPKVLARSALGLVGADPDAEEIWVNAINDPNRSSNERKDLIEDLNEDGFPDPKNVTEDDLPLILSRLMLIEELAPDAIDEVNADAFQEAYKDLVNMLERLGRN
jgi:hypothetical protein